MNGSFHLHRITSIEVGHDRHESSAWTSVTFHAENGDRFTVYAFPDDQGAFLPVLDPQTAPAEDAA